MANPLSAFRPYAKPFFVIMGILCMITFVLSSGTGGRGDLFTQIGDYFGGSRNPAVASIDGRRLDGAAIHQVQAQRQLADQFISMAVGQAENSVARKAIEGVTKLDPTAQRFVREQLFMARQTDFTQYLRFAGLYEQLLAPNARKTALDEKKQDQVEAIDAILAMIALDRQLAAVQRNAGDGYFGGKIDSIEDTVNFLVWRGQADKLGIQFFDSDVIAAVAYECQGRLESSEPIEKVLRDRYGERFSHEVLLHSLGEEFRVRAAQAALTGTALRTHTAIATTLTPDESWDLFRDARTQLKLYVMPVPTASYLAQVTGQPSATEIKQLYDQFKAEEASPALERPGFKEPRRIGVQYIEAGVNMPFYQMASKQFGPLMEAMLQFGAATGGADAGIGWELPQVVFAANNLLANVREIDSYQQYVSNAPAWNDTLVTRMHDTSVWRPETAASLFAASLAGFGTGAPVVSGPLTFEGAAVTREMQDRIVIGSTQILAGVLEPGGLAIPGLTLAVTPPTPTYAEVKGLLAEQRRDALADFVLRTDLQGFFLQSVLKEAGDPSRKGLKDYFYEFIAYRGLPKGGTTEPRNAETILTDPGMQPLVEAYQKAAAGRDPQLRGFASSFFDAPRNSQNQPMPDKTYSPQVYQFKSQRDSYTLHWKTDDLPSRIVPLDKVRDKVEQAWRLAKARELAQKAATTLSEEARKLNGDPQRLRDLAAAKGLSAFEVGPLALRNPVLTPNANAMRSYTPFSLPDDKVPYPGRLPDELIGLRKQPVGATMAAPDAPKGHYYVTTLLEKIEPTPEEFRRTYRQSMENAAERDPLLNELAQAKRDEFRRELLLQLRAEAKAQVFERGKKDE